MYFRASKWKRRIGVARTMPGLELETDSSLRVININIAATKAIYRSNFFFLKQIGLAIVYFIKFRFKQAKNVRESVQVFSRCLNDGDIH